MNEVARGGSETILVAEDNETLRRLAGTILDKYGYTVILAEDGNDAIEKFTADKDSISLVILDMMMPGKNGREAFDIMKTLKPSVRALFTSGYTDDVMCSHGITDTQLDFMMKPISPIDLLKKVREMLDR